VVLEQAGDFEAAHAGHHQVEDDHVGAFSFAAAKPVSPLKPLSIV